MALNLAAGLAGAGTPDLFSGVFLPAAPVAVRGLPHHAPRMVVPRNDSSVPTVNMFIDGASPRMQYAASIVDVCADTTTYALQCTSGPSTILSGACGANAPVRPPSLNIGARARADSRLDPHPDRQPHAVPRLDRRQQR